MEKDQELIEGFNAGYIIEKHRPELAKQLVNGLDGIEVPFIIGFVAGSKEFIKERELGKSKAISRLRGFAKGNIKIPSKRNNKEDRGFEIDL